MPNDGEKLRRMILRAKREQRMLGTAPQSDAWGAPSLAPRKAAKKRGNYKKDPDAPKRKRGRPFGSCKKRTQEIVAKALKEGITPLEYMLQVLRDPNSPVDDRKWAAAAAAPFMHPRLAAQVNQLDPSRPPVAEVQVSFVRAPS